MHEELGYFLALRLRVRENPDALAIVDRCIAIMARAQTATGPELAQLDDEVAALAVELKRRFGARAHIAIH